MLDTNAGGFNYEFLRAISYQAIGASELGECLAMAARMHESDFESWIQEWTWIADRVAQEAEAAPQKGRRISARGAFGKTLSR